MVETSDGEFWTGWKEDREGIADGDIEAISVRLEGQEVDIGTAVGEGGLREEKDWEKTSCVIGTSSSKVTSSGTSTSSNAINPSPSSLPTPFANAPRTYADPLGLNPSSPETNPTS